MMAGGAVMLLLLAMAYAPLVHVHAHAGESPVIHAHFPEIEIAEDESVVHMERPHSSHSDARAIDLLTTTATPSVHFDAIIAIAHIDLSTAVSPCEFMAAATPRAHSPPDLESQIPRAPPA
jgi:hypothetical protein